MKTFVGHDGFSDIELYRQFFYHCIYYIELKISSIIFQSSTTCDNVCRVFESSFVSNSDFLIVLRMRSGLMGGCGQF